MKSDTTFERIMLRQVAAEARQLGASIREAWVHRTLNTWEFFYREFYWYGRAENAWDAKSKGWNAWLEKQQTAA